jgi:hypothetical protein
VALVGGAVGGGTRDLHAAHRNDGPLVGGDRPGGRWPAVMVMVMVMVVLVPGSCADTCRPTPSKDSSLPRCRVGPARTPTVAAGQGRPGGESDRGRRERGARSARPHHPPTLSRPTARDGGNDGRASPAAPCRRGAGRGPQGGRPQSPQVAEGWTAADRRELAPPRAGRGRRDRRYPPRTRKPARVGRPDDS